MRLLIVALALLTTTPAFAGWRDLEWGQSSTSVLAREGVSELTGLDKAKRDTTWGDLALAYEQREIAGDTALAIYYFRDGGLSMIDLEIDHDANRGQAERALEDLYGAPDVEQRFGGNCLSFTRTWLHRQTGNRIEHNKADCGSAIAETIRFSPMQTAESSGL